MARSVAVLRVDAKPYELPSGIDARAHACCRYGAATTSCSHREEWVLEAQSRFPQLLLLAYDSLRLQTAECLLHRRDRNVAASSDARGEEAFGGAGALRSSNPRYTFRSSVGVVVS